MKFQQNAQIILLKFNTNAHQMFYAQITLHLLIKQTVLLVVQ